MIPLLLITRDEKHALSLSYNEQGTTIGNICKKLFFFKKIIFENFFLKQVFFQVAQCRKTQKEAIQAH